MSNMSAAEHIQDNMDADLTGGSSSQHKKGHGDYALAQVEREKQLERALHQAAVHHAQQHTQPAAQPSGPHHRREDAFATGEIKIQFGSDRKGLTGRAEQDIIRLLWDAYQPDSNDELGSDRLDNVMNDFGLCKNTDQQIADLLKKSGRSRVDFAQFAHWWKDHGKTKADGEKSVWFVLDTMRHIFNAQLSGGRSENSAVTLESFKQLLLSPQWAALLDCKPVSAHASTRRQGAAADDDAKKAEWANETAVDVFNRLGFSTSASTTYSLTELWWAFATNKQVLAILYPHMIKPSPDIRPSHSRA